MIYRKLSIGFAFFAGISFGLGFLHPWGGLQRAAGRDENLVPAAPPQVRQILQTKCGDCHSNSTRWPAYSRFAPASWLMERDVQAGRRAINFSAWSAMSSEQRVSALTRIAAELRTGEMPPRAYTLMHPGNRLTVQEQQITVAWARAERKHIKTSNDQQQWKDRE